MIDGIAGATRERKGIDRDEGAERERESTVDASHPPRAEGNQRERDPAECARVDVGQQLVVIELVQVEPVDDPDPDRDQEDRHGGEEQVSDHVTMRAGA